MPRTQTRLDPALLVALLAAEEVTDETDVRILRAAAQAVVADGPSTFEVDDVAAAAGVGRSTVYRRYGDRNGLLAAAMAHEGRRLLDVLAEAAAPLDDLVEEIVAAFCAGVRFALAIGLADLARSDPVVLHLLTVDSGAAVAAAADHLALLAVRRDPTVEPAEARRSAEVLVRLALSFALSPDTELGEDGDLDEDAVRRHVVGVVTGRSRFDHSSSVVAAPTS